MAYYLEKFIITIDENGKETKTEIPSKEKADFIALHNHQNGRAIRQTETQFIALEENEVFVNGEVIIDEDYYIKKEEEAKKKEAERIANLNMTRGDFFEGMILAQGITKPQIRALIENYEGIDDITRTVYLNRFDEAINFYRGYPLFDMLATALNITTQQLDMFFETKDYTYLQVKTEEKLPTNETVLPEELTEEVIATEM